MSITFIVFSTHNNFHYLGFFCESISADSYFYWFLLMFLGLYYLLGNAIISCYNFEEKEICHLIISLGVSTFLHSFPARRKHVFAFSIHTVSPVTTCCLSLLESKKEKTTHKLQRQIAVGLCPHLYYNCNSWLFALLHQGTGGKFMPLHPPPAIFLGMSICSGCSPV